MRAVRAEKEFDLEPDGLLVAERLAPAAGAGIATTALAVADRTGAGDDVDAVGAGQRARPAADHVVGAGVAGVAEDARDMARDLCAYIILKGHYSALCLPDGGVVFNTTGNSGMATAGSGDVLTGIITALLARGYSRKNACLMGMYLHGMAGDIAAKRVGKESLIASDIIDSLPEAFKNLEK